MRRENFKMCSNLREFLLYFAVDLGTGFIKDRFEDRIINIHINCTYFVDILSVVISVQINNMYGAGKTDR